MIGLSLMRRVQQYDIDCVKWKDCGDIVQYLKLNLPKLFDNDITLIIFV
jgi:hypothetical protein